MFFSAAKHGKHWIAPLFGIALFTLYVWRETPGHNWYLGALLAGAWYVCATRSLGTALFIGMILREAWRSWPRKGGLRTWLYLAALLATFIALALVSSHLRHSDSGISSLLWITLWAVSLPLALRGLYAAAAMVIADALIIAHELRWDDAARLAPLLAQEPQRYVRIYENGEFDVRRSAANASYLPTAWNL
jgi:hypothetical protein